MEPPKKKLKFRLQARQIFLTYSQCDLPKRELLEFLQSKLSVDRYIIAVEKHEDGRPHLHAYLKLAKKCDIKNQNWLDCLVTPQGTKTFIPIWVA